MNKNIKVTEEVKRTADMGILSINEVLSILDNEEMIKVIDEQLAFYYSLSIRANEIIENANADAKPNPITGFITKTMIKLNTMMDSTASKISELMINGTVMGIISILKVYNKEKCCLNPEIISLVDDTLGKLGGFVENLKSYL